MLARTPACETCAIDHAGNGVWRTGTEWTKVLNEAACAELPVVLFDGAVARMDVFEFMWSDFESGFPVAGSGGQLRGHEKKPPEGWRAFCLKKSDDAVVLLSTTNYQVFECLGKTKKIKGFRVSGPRKLVHRRR